jgi:hypothetical protein
MTVFFSQYIPFHTRTLTDDVRAHPGNRTLRSEVMWFGSSYYHNTYC